MPGEKIDNEFSESNNYCRPVSGSGGPMYMSRRSVLGSIVGAGIAGAAFGGTVGRAAAAESALLGDFEEGLDEWKTNGGNRLGRVSRDEENAPVTQGNHALEVRINGDPQPVIRNQKRIRRSDPASNPYLMADVLPGTIEGTDSPVAFRFRYRSKGPGGIEESPETTVKQRYGARLVWDMSGIADGKLDSPHRLEIAWYPEEHPPKTGPQGRGPGFDYRGRTYFDNVHLTDDRGQVTVTRWTRKLRSLERSYGLRVDSRIDQSTETLQTGAFVYKDGTNVSYRAELLDDGDIRVDINDDSFRFTGGDA